MMTVYFFGSLPEIMDLRAVCSLLFSVSAQFCLRAAQGRKRGCSTSYRGGDGPG